jgi:hypothetical protein
LRWLCRIDWHGPIITTGTLGPLTYGHCRTCGKTGQLDSQGMLF